MGWQIIKNRIDSGMIPKWLAEELLPKHEGDDDLTKCPYCHLPLIINDNLTYMRCADFYCIGHMKKRADEMLKKLGVKNIGPETCEGMLKAIKAKSHVDIIPVIFKEKPRAYLWQIADYCSIPGYSGTLEELMVGYNSFKNYFQEEPYIPEAIRAFKKDLIAAQDKFTVLPSLAKYSINVMISDSVTGFPNKQSFVDKCNSLAGETVRVVLGGKKKDQDYLITDNRASGYSKIDYALEHGIPIITSLEFIAVLAMTVAKKKQSTI